MKISEVNISSLLSRAIAVSFLAFGTLPAHANSEIMAQSTLGYTDSEPVMSQEQIDQVNLQNNVALEDIDQNGVLALRRVDRVDSNQLTLNLVVSNPGPVQTKYPLFNVTMTCVDADQCKLYSAGIYMTISTTNIYDAKSGVRIYVDVYQNGVLVENVPAMSFSGSGTVRGVKNLATPRVINSSNTITLKYFASATFTGSPLVDWVTIKTAFSMVGKGFNSTVVQAKPNVPVMTTPVLRTGTTNTYDYTASTRYREDNAFFNRSEVKSIDKTLRTITIDVNMTNYTRTVVYTPPTFTSVTPETYSDEAYVKDSFTINTYGYYSFRTRAADFEAKLSTEAYKNFKHNPYNAPATHTAVYQLVGGVKKIKSTWTPPTTHILTGQAITDGKGYLLHLRNYTTKAYVYSYKTEAGLATTTYTTPNAIPPGEYDMIVCGWSNTLSEGNCRSSAKITVP